MLSMWIALDFLAGFRIQIFVGKSRSKIDKYMALAIDAETFFSLLLLLLLFLFFSFFFFFFLLLFSFLLLLLLSFLFLFFFFLLLFIFFLLLLLLLYHAIAGFTATQADEISPMNMTSDPNCWASQVSSWPGKFNIHNLTRFYYFLKAFDLQAALHKWLQRGIAARNGTVGAALESTKSHEVHSSEPSRLCRRSYKACRHSSDYLWSQWTFDGDLTAFAGLGSQLGHWVSLMVDLWKRYGKQDSLTGNWPGWMPTRWSYLAYSNTDVRFMAKYDTSLLFIQMFRLISFRFKASCAALIQVGRKHLKVVAVNYINDIQWSNDPPVFARPLIKTQFCRLTFSPTSSSVSMPRRFQKAVEVSPLRQSQSWADGNRIHFGASLRRVKGSGVDVAEMCKRSKRRCLHLGMGVPKSKHAGDLSSHLEPFELCILNASLSARMHSSLASKQIAAVRRTEVSWECRAWFG